MKTSEILMDILTGTSDLIVLAGFVFFILYLCHGLNSERSAFNRYRKMAQQRDNKNKQRILELENQVQYLEYELRQVKKYQRKSY